ncbi:MAG: hypothetical protein MUW56_14435 [Chryseobacterium sp.]|uniref:hypothetical protein n=1 Tax=Chryseobacterium sp. TaxID=1871047 RepID=UPI0025BE66B1|nr:hypothetical protein [Chryseobacterium sp.]MCJ7934784.1 hypothetical protein [Chryseobacterium sp.]
MKKTIYMLGCLSIVLMPNIACSNLDSNDNAVETTSMATQSGSSNFSTGKDIVDPAVMVKASSIIRDEVKSDLQLVERFRNPPIVNGKAQYVDKAILDHMITAANLTQYSSQITVDMVNRMVAESIEMQKVGFDKYMSNSKLLSPVMKDYVNRLAYDDVTIQDFQAESNFINLSDNEQNILANMDNFNTYYNSSRLIFTGFGAGFGMIIGGMLFGMPGMIIGGIVGGIVGSIFDK